MDRLEEFIRKNRESLDSRTPSDDVWKKVRKDLRTGRPVRYWFAAAASVAVLCVLSIAFYQLGKNSVEIKLESLTPSGIQLREAEAYYSSQVNALYNEAEPLLTTNPELRAELNNDLLRIDSIYADLRKDLKDNIANEEVVEALIRNYTMKIEILKDMLAVLRENDNNEKPDSHEL